MIEEYAIVSRLFQPGGGKGLGMGKISALGKIFRGWCVRESGSKDVLRGGQKKKRFVLQNLLTWLWGQQV